MPTAWRSPNLLTALRAMRTLSAEEARVLSAVDAAARERLKADLLEG